MRGLLSSWLPHPTDESNLVNAKTRKKAPAQSLLAPPQVIDGTGQYKYALPVGFDCLFEASQNDELGTPTKVMLSLRTLLTSLACAVLATGVAAAPPSEKAGTCSELRLFKEW